MNWIDEEWIIDVMLRPTKDIDFNNFRKYELVDILNKIRLMFLRENEKLLKGGQCEEV